MIKENATENLFNVSFDRKVLDPHIWIDSKMGTFSTPFLASFNIKGWLKTTGRVQPKVHVKLKDGRVKNFLINRVRDDVKAYLDDRYDDQFISACGFSFIEDLCDVSMIGYSTQGPVRWEYDVSITRSEEVPSVRMIVGPSHVYRLEWAIKDRLIPDIKGRYQFIRKGGMPIWSQLVTDIMTTNRSGQLFFIVGDFRFGNQILEDEAYPRLDLPWQYSGIEKNLISQENDNILYRMCCQRIKDIIDDNDKAQFLFWDLSIREYENRHRGRYFHDGQYRHPVWNYADVEGMFSRNILDSSDILEDGEKLYIDSSAHPSIMGFAYLWHKINCKRPFDINEKQARLTNALHQVFFQAMGNAPVHIAGNSVFIRFLMKYTNDKTMPLPLNFSFELSEKVQDITPKDHLVFVLPIRSFKLTDARISYFIDSYREQISRLREIHGKVSVLIYDNWACEVTSQKKQYKDWYAPKSDLGRTATLEQRLCPEDQTYRLSHTVNPQKLLEINHVLSPNLYGVMEILLRLTSGLTRFEIEQAYETVVNSIFQMDDLVSAESITECAIGHAR